jgi:predicted kinase
MTSDGNRRPTLGIVSGPPGSGKTTLARMLANALSCPLISRDEINEGILQTFSHVNEVANKDRVAKSTFDAFFRVIELLVCSDVTLVAEAAFQDQRWRIGLEPLVPKADIKVIHCTVGPEVAHQRIIRRRHEQKDVLRSTRASSTRAADAPTSAVLPFEPLALPVPSLCVATTDGYDPPLDEIVAFLTSR